MQADFMDRFSRLDSVVHRRPAGLKLTIALGLVLALVLVPSAWVLAPAASLLVTAAALSRIPPAFLLRRLLILEPFVLGAAVLVLFEEDGTRRFALLIARATLCLATMILLANTTPFSELLRVMRRVRLPGLFITTLALMYRYLFVLVDETQRMRRARASRTFTASRRRVWAINATIIGQLFIRASERAERIYAAMCARGWR